MKAQWQTVMKPAFLSDIQKLQARDLQQVMEKINLLAQDPQPDGHTKKQVLHVPGKPYRIRSGDYRIFYTFKYPIVTIYKLGPRKEGYKIGLDMDDELAAEMLDEADLPTELLAETAETAEKTTQPDWEKIFTTSQVRPLPEAITPELLKTMSVPEAYHKRLLNNVKSEDDLLSCPGIDDEVLLQIHEYMFDQPLVQVMQQPDLVLNDVDDLMRYKHGDLLGFLLKLSPEQERYASWSLKVKGPTLVKGGPGTGKSTVALYRVRSLLEQLLKIEKGQPRILFTTYTNALVKSSEQLLKQLLGKDAHYVTVTTADSIAYEILDERDQENPIQRIEDEALPALTEEAITLTTFPGSSLQQRLYKQAIQRIGLKYLLEELNTVIVARQVATLAEYLPLVRGGRKLPLNTLQRTAVWHVYERWCALLQERGYETWQQRRARAASLVQDSLYARYYDGVVIDEAQDLDPSLLRMLIATCKGPERLFITADANQTIYKNGFNWSDVSDVLQFRGRATNLNINYRSTSEIGLATQSYLQNGTLEDELTTQEYMNNGPVPDVRMVLNQQHEIQLLIKYFQKASRSLSFAIGSCAILCPTESAGRELAAALSEQNIEATYMSGRDLNLNRPGVKIMTLKSSKGLEFPIVALAGFTMSTYPAIPENATVEEREEILQRERRTLFVGMTRAMRVLLIIIPRTNSSPLLQNFHPDYWNFDRSI